VASNLTASGLERAMACPASTALPAIHESSDYAERGSAIGRFVRGVLGGLSVDRALVDVRPEWRETCLQLEWPKIVGGLHDVRGEMAYAILTPTMEVRELGSNLGRNYPKLPDSWVFGTNDVEGTGFDDVPVVTDLKSGQEVTEAKANPQVKFHGLARHLRTGAPTVEGRLQYIEESGKVWTDPHRFDAFDLQVFGDEMADTVVRMRRAREAVARGESVTVYSGDHCRYCPAMMACPRYTSLARRMLPDLQELVQQGNVEAVTERFSIMPMEQRAKAWTLAADASRLVDTVQEALKAIARREPIRGLPNGKMVEERTYPRTSFVQDKALEMLRAKGATDDEIATLYTEKNVAQVKMVNDPTVPKNDQAKKKSRKRRAA